jgi:hypothetical protein
MSRLNQYVSKLRRYKIETFAEIQSMIVEIPQKEQK